MRPYILLFRLAAIAFVCAAVYHFVAAVYPAIEKVVYGAGWLPGYPRWRHLMWVGIFPTVAGLLLWRPRWLVWPYLVLVLQQLHGHGGNVVRLWEQSGRISWTDAGVLTGEFLLLGLLLVDRWKRRGQADALRVGG